MGDGPVVWAEPGAGCAHPPLLRSGTGCEAEGYARKVWCGSIHGTRSAVCPGGMPRLPMAPQTLYNRFRPCSDKGVFGLIFSEVSASDAPEQEVLTLDATALKARPTPSSRNKGGLIPA